MIQAYFFSVIWLLVLSALLLVGPYGWRLSWLLDIRRFFISSAPVRLGMTSSGFILGILLLFFPIHPGPPILGDLVPAAVILGGSFWLMKTARRIASWYRYLQTGTKHLDSSFQPLKPESLFSDAPGENQRLIGGYVALVVAVIHFAVPMAVLL